MVCSCAISSYCVNWLQITFCSCLNETVLFSFLRSLLRENGRSLRFPKIFIKKQTRWSNGKTHLNSVIAKYHDLSVSHRSIICLSHLLATDKSGYFSQPFLLGRLLSQMKGYCQTCTQVMELVSIQTGCDFASVDWYPKFDFTNWVDHWFHICDITLHF